MLWLGLEGRKKLKTLETSMEQLRDDQERLLRGFKHLEMEWSDTLDKLNHLNSRIAARQRRAPAADTTVEYDDGVDPISRDLLKFRNRATPNGK